ncbi:MAG TPA: CAP domain-containing protein [Chitinophagaceae bacterium]|jgi:uncharacterized protein YkwD|nr:CAP domain-containing protein [Chitinophagaceae bacterium]
MKAIFNPFVIFSIILFCVCTSCHRKTVPASSVTRGATSNTSRSNTHVDIKEMTSNILSYINEHRRAIGLGNLQELDVAAAQAAKHSADMAAHRVAFGHSGFEARASAISKSLGSLSAAAENVADGKLTARQVVDGWLHSPGHKKNIEGNYSLTGIGVATDAGGVLYFTQIFVRK